jgi:hypothetical protein
MWPKGLRTVPGCKLPTTCNGDLTVVKFSRALLETPSKMAKGTVGDLASPNASIEWSPEQSSIAVSVLPGD